MIETFTALLFAHVLADFTFQTNWINANKARPQVLLLHAAIVWITAHAALGIPFSPEITALAAAHLIIDAIKTYGRFRSLTAFLADQAAHLVTLCILSAFVPDLWLTGAWAPYPVLLPLLALLTGLILTLTAGQHVVGLLMKPHSIRIRNTGLRDGGRQIGLLERGLIYVLLLANQPLGVGFLIAAKSVLRFGTAMRDQRLAEYVIIGTLASFGWAILVTLAIQALLPHLPPLEITLPKP